MKLDINRNDPNLKIFQPDKFLMIRLILSESKDNITIYLEIVSMDNLIVIIEIF